MNLSKFKQGEIGEVIGYTGSPSSHRQKLLSLGLAPKLRFKIERIAPFDGPMQLRLSSGTSISLRRQESEIVEATPVEE